MDVARLSRVSPAPVRSPSREHAVHLAGLLGLALSGCVNNVSAAVGVSLDTNGGVAVVGKVAAAMGFNVTPEAEAPEHLVALTSIVDFELSGGYDFAHDAALFYGDLGLVGLIVTERERGRGLWVRPGLRITSSSTDERVLIGPSVKIAGVWPLAADAREGCQIGEHAGTYHQLGPTLDAAWVFGGEGSRGMLFVGAQYQLQAYYGLCFSERAEPESAPPLAASVTSTPDP
jgi:hypothetical protein